MFRLGGKIKKLRKAQGLSQEKVAAELGLSRQAVSKWESDQSQPDLENVIKLCRIFQISVEELLDMQSEKTELNCPLQGKNQLLQKKSKMYLYKSLLCLAGAVLMLMAIYVILLFKPELRVGANDEIQHMYQLKLWINNDWFPLLACILAGIVMSVFFFYKFMETKEQNREGVL